MATNTGPPFDAKIYREKIRYAMNRKITPDLWVTEDFNFYVSGGAGIITTYECATCHTKFKDMTRAQMHVIDGCERVSDTEFNDMRQALLDRLR